jgi:hypothetical protein
MKQRYLTTREAIDFISQTIKQPVKYYDLDNLIRSEAIPEPEQIAGRRIWSTDELRNACKALRIRRAKRPILTDKRLERFQTKNGGGKND